VTPAPKYPALRSRSRPPTWAEGRRASPGSRRWPVVWHDHQRSAASGRLRPHRHRWRQARLLGYLAAYGCEREDGEWIADFRRWPERGADCPGP
jgi:hypothetical protein